MMEGLGTVPTQTWWTKTVAIDRWGDVYHDPSTLGCTRDMTVLTIGEAHQYGSTAHPCSACFGMDGIVPPINDFDNPHDN